MFDRRDAEAKMAVTIEASGVSQEGLRVRILGTAPGDEANQLKDRISEFFRAARLTPMSEPSEAEAETPEEARAAPRIGAAGEGSEADQAAAAAPPTPEGAGPRRI